MSPLRWACGRRAGVFNNGAVLFLAENDADGGILILLPNLPVKGGQIKLHFAEKLRLEFPDFQLNRYQTAQPSVKQQQDITVVTGS